MLHYDPNIWVDVGLNIWVDDSCGTFLSVPEMMDRKDLDIIDTEGQNIS